MSLSEFDFFLSFSGDDRELADRVYAALVSPTSGHVPYKVCYQPIHFPLASEFTEEIDRAHRQSKVVIALLTPNYLATSIWTRAEFNAALKDGKLLIFRFGGATIPPHADAASISYQDFDVRPGELGFDELVRKSARLQPTHVGGLARRVELQSNMPDWKGASQLLGREEELDALTKAFHDPTCGTVCVIADGGFGKSSLVSWWLKSIQNEPTPNAWMGVKAGYAYSFYKQGWAENTAISSTPFFEECLSFLTDVPRKSLPEGGPKRQCH